MPRNVLNIPLYHYVVVAHFARAAATVFCQLKNHRYNAVKIAYLRKIFHHPKQHGALTIMTSGMHHSLRATGIIHASRLFDRQGIHIGAQPNDFAHAVYLAFN